MGNKAGKTELYTKNTKNTVKNRVDSHLEIRFILYAEKNLLARRGKYSGGKPMKKTIKKVVVAGGGLMGAGISLMFPEYEIETVLYSVSDFEKAERVIEKSLTTLVENGRMTRQKADEIKEKIQFTTDKKCFEDTDLVIEAIPEIMDVKKSFYEEISELVPEDAILASNTSAISVNQLSEFVKFPERFCGTHFLNPPHIIPLVEITKGDKTEQAVCETLYALFEEMGKEPVLLKKDVKGFLSNRLQFALLREATYLVEQGVAEPKDIDRTIKYGNGLRYTCSGPFKIADLGGLSVFNSVAKYLYSDLADEKVENHLLDELVESGNNGISTGKGFYEYQESDFVNEEKTRDAMILGILKTEKELLA